jgi:hypothetical protein
MCCTGVVSTVSWLDIMLVIYNANVYIRCRAPPNDLDGDESERRRTKDFTEALVKTYDVPTLWSEHGIVSDIIVSSYSSLSDRILNNI